MEVEKTTHMRGSPRPLPVELPKPWVPSLRIVAAYLALSLIWITFSDRVVHGMSDDPATLSRIQTYKGWAFVTLSAAILFFIVRRTIAAVQAVQSANEESTELLRGIFESSALGIVVMDETGHYVTVNPAFAELVGRPVDSLVGAHFNLVTMDEDNEKTEKLYEDLRAGVGARLAVEKRYLRPDGTERWALVTAAPLRNAGRSFAVAVVKDITLRLERERHLRQTLLELQETDEHRKALLSDLLKAEETEQQRIAEDIHDDSMQYLTSAAMTLDLLAGKLTEPEHIALTERTADLIRTSISRLRKLVFDLKPPELESQGLLVVVERLLEDLSEEARVEYELIAPRSVSASSEISLILYKVAREALHNIRKHAQAHRITIELAERSGGIAMSIADDGVGFEPATGRLRTKHFGLRQMVDRIEAARGRVQVHAAPGRGTRIECWLPRELGEGRTHRAA